jgi:hypothetical protein
MKLLTNIAPKALMLSALICALSLTGSLDLTFHASLGASAASAADTKVINPGKTKVTGSDLQDTSISSIPSKGNAEWFSDTMPWDGKWGAFNKTDSESVQGACALDKKQLGNLNDLIEALTYDEANLAKAKKKDKLGKFSDYYKKRINGQAGVDQSESKVAIKEGLRTYLPKSAKSVDDFKQQFYANPNVSGCDNMSGLERLAKLFQASRPQLSEIFLNPISMLLSMPTSLIGMVSATGVVVAAPYAVPWTLSTPHTERGDLIFDTSSTGSKSTAKASCSSSAGKSKMGFNCKNLSNRKSETKWWIQWAKGLRSSMSILYGIIVMLVAMGYVFRKSEGGAMDARRVLPRVVLSVALAAMAPYLIGMAISLSNLTTKAILTAAPGNPIDQIVDALVAVTTGRDPGVAGFLTNIMFGPIRSMLSAGVLGVTAVGMWMLLAFAVVKQIVLIALVIGTPIAVLSLVVESWSEKIFQWWVRGLIAVIMLPVVQALVLVIGMSMANIFGKGGMGISAIVGAVILVVAIRAMVKANSMARGFVTGKGSNHGMRRMAGKATEMAAPAAGLAANFVAPGSGAAVAGAVSGSGRAITSSANTASARDQKMAGKARNIAGSIPGVSKASGADGLVGQLPAQATGQAKSLKSAFTDGKQSGKDNFASREETRNGKQEETGAPTSERPQVENLPAEASPADGSTMPPITNTDSGARSNVAVEGDRSRTAAPSQLPTPAAGAPTPVSPAPANPAPVSPAPANPAPVSPAPANPASARPSAAPVNPNSAKIAPTPPPAAPPAPPVTPPAAAPVKTTLPPKLP